MALGMNKISTHVLDTMMGKGATGLVVFLDRREPSGQWLTLGVSRTDQDGRCNQLRGEVYQLGYLGNRCTYQVKTTTGKLVTVFAQNERRTSEWSIDWSDQVYVSWSADAAVLLQS